jgi:hypothetical protein
MLVCWYAACCLLLLICCFLLDRLLLATDAMPLYYLLLFMNLTSEKDSRKSRELIFGIFLLFLKKKPNVFSNWPSSARQQRWRVFW